MSPVLPALAGRPGQGARGMLNLYSRPAHAAVASRSGMEEGMHKKGGYKIDRIEEWDYV